jgi:hypothetical protein
LQIAAPRPLNVDEESGKSGKMSAGEAAVTARRVFQRLLDQSPTPERCLEVFHLQRTRFELIVERKIRRRQLTDVGNVAITGHDLLVGGGSAARCSMPVLGHEAKTEPERCAGALLELQRAP